MLAAGDNDHLVEMSPVLKYLLEEWVLMPDVTHVPEMEREGMLAGYK